MMKINLIMLAAGLSSRFGENKLLHCIDGIPLYQRTLDTYLPLFCEFDISAAIVSGCDEITNRCSAFENIKTIRNTHPEYGISYSIKLGLDCCFEPNDGCAYMFSVCDQPYLETDTVRGLLKLFLAAEKNICAPQCGGEIGNPVIFGNAYRSLLYALTGDSGGKKLLHSHMDDTALLRVDNPRELFDIDFKYDLYTGV